MTVQTMRSRLSHSDLVALTRSTNDDERAAATRKICRRIDATPLSDGETQQAEEILRILSRDAAELVRRAMAVTLSNSPKLPRDVAQKLAQDIDSIAMPILERSPMLSDRDLAEFIQSGSVERQVAIASRPIISAALGRFIVSKADREAVARVVANDGAELDEPALNHVLQRFPKDTELSDSMAHRDTLPMIIVEKLINVVSRSAFDHLVNHHELPPQLAIEIATGARERATLDLVAQAGMASDMERFVQQLALNGRLTPSLVVRAALMGHMRFLEWSLAELAGVPHRKTWLMVHDAGPLGLRAIFERSGLPSRMFPAIRTAVDVFHASESEGLADNRDAFRRRMLQRTLTQFQALPREDADYLLDRLDALDNGTGPMLKSA